METTARAIPHIADLESHLGYWLRRVSNAVSGAFSRSLQEKQTSVAEWVLLRELHERGQAAPSELADVLGFTRGAISKIVDKLEAKSWILTASKEGDDRSRLLTLTREGRRILPALATIADRNDAHFFDCLSFTERRTLRELLTKVAVHHDIHIVPTE
jgi:DNA-binding MarR family transcriptional regulator